MVDAPLTNGRNGDTRDGRGRFAKGNPGGPGNPYVKHVAATRRAIAECVTADDIRAVIAQLVKAARDGERWAIRELLDRTVGKSPSFSELVLAERVEQLEAMLAEQTAGCVR